MRYLTRLGVRDWLIELRNEVGSNKELEFGSLTDDCRRIWEKNVCGVIGYV